MPPPSSLFVSVVALDQEDASAEALLPLVVSAISQNSRLIVIPFGQPKLQAAAAHGFYSRLARTHQVFIVAGWVQARRPRARIYSPKGRLLGEQIQTHRLPGENFRPGKSLTPIPTPLGKIGISLGSDLYFPESHWSLARQGADILIHLDRDAGIQDHFYSTLSPKVRAMDCHRPLVIARASSRAISVVHNEEMEIAGTGMNPSIIIDQNGATLASTGFSQGVATAGLRFHQHCQSREKLANMLLSKGLDAWKYYFNDSREKYFAALSRKFPRPRKPSYKKRKIRIAIVTHQYAHQLGKDDAPLLALVREACRHRPDIVVCTEMEAECRPDSPKVARSMEKMVQACRKAGCYLLIGGVRASHPGKLPDRSSHAWLWDRAGKRVFESAIMLYGRGCGQDVYDTDFGRIGIRLCGDVYAPELDRLFAAKGADIVFNPSMSWGASGQINAEYGQVRAMDNGHYVVNAHLAFSDAGQRSQVIDPMGGIVAASSYWENSLLLSDIDLDVPRGIFVPTGTRKVNPKSYLAGYRTRTRYSLLPTHRLLQLRRPELYRLLDVDLPNDPFVTRDRGDGCMLPLPGVSESN